MSVQGGFGAVLKIGTAPGQAITHIMEYELPEFEKVLADVTAHDSPGGYTEFIATGKRKGSDFTCTLLWDKTDTTHQAVQAAFDSLDPVLLRAESPDGSDIIEFTAHIFKIKRIMEQDEGFKCEVSIQPTGSFSFPSV